ncbi:MAG: ATP-binding protein [Armatimonadota bacterium]|jgi:serine/threonine-protein kinase RsbW
MESAGCGWGGDAIEIRVPCKPEYVRTIRRTIAEFAGLIDMPRQAIEEVEIAASEAASNVVRHAYSGMAKCGQPIRVKCAYKAGDLIIEIIDKGSGFAVPTGQQTHELDLSRDGGFGIMLIRCLMDKVSFSSQANGTRVRMAKRAGLTAHEISVESRQVPNKCSVATGKADFSLRSK